MIRGSRSISQHRKTATATKNGRLSAPAYRIPAARVGANPNNSCDDDGHVERAGPIFYTCHPRLHLFGAVEVVCGDGVRCGTVPALFHHPGTAW